MSSPRLRVVLSHSQHTMFGESGFILAERGDLIESSIYDIYSVGPCIRTHSTRCCFTMTDMILCKFHRARVFIIDTRPDESMALEMLPRDARRGL